MSTSSSSQPTQPTTSSPSSPSTQPYRPLLLTVLLVSPILALLPPRKLDLYTFTLGSAFVLSAEELTLGQSRRQRTGSTGVMGVLGSAQVDAPTGEREERLRPGLGIGGEGTGQISSLGLGGGNMEESGAREDVDGKEEGEEGGVKSLAKKLWMGGETDGWEKRRLEKEKEDLGEGKGYGDIIMDQVREVFPGFGGGAGVERDERGRVVSSGEGES